MSSERWSKLKRPGKTELEVKTKDILRARSASARGQGDSSCQHREHMRTRFWQENNLHLEQAGLLSAES